MYGPPGTGKTLLARACAAQTDATFLKLAGPQLVQMFIGDGAKLVRDCFALAKEKAPSIIFIDELDAVGTKRFDSDKSGDREVQRTMLELLNQLDGFASDDRIKVLAATNRVDVLDPALLRSGRLDRKIEFPLPNEESRAQILRIHSRKMTVDEGVNWPELARSTDEFGGAMLKAVCVEAGMIALRSGQSKIIHEHYVDAISEVQSKKKESCVHPNTTSLKLAYSPQNLDLRLRWFCKYLAGDLHHWSGVRFVMHGPVIIAEHSSGRQRFSGKKPEYDSITETHELGSFLFLDMAARDGVLTKALYPALQFTQLKCARHIDSLSSIHRISRMLLSEPDFY